jgi:hypothetical protein
MFIQDLKLGHEYERKCLQYLDYDEIHHEPHIKTATYDLIITKDNIPYKIEVKCDRLSCKTGNIVIEYECREKPSGIETTTADFWVYVIINKECDDEYYKIPVETLKELVKNSRKIRGGDGWKSRMYLLKKDLIQNFKINPH